MVVFVGSLKIYRVLVILDYFLKVLLYWECFWRLVIGFIVVSVVENVGEWDKFLRNGD